jgi:hypothetical protein
MRSGYAIGFSLWVMLGLGAPRAGAATGQEIQITWEGLVAIIGQNVRLVMPDGARIEGKAMALEMDALVVGIRKSSNQPAYPRGKFLVPRATLKAVDVERPTKVWRIVCTAGGGGIAIVFATLAAGTTTGGWHTRTGIYTGLAVGTPLLGYLLGRAADRHTITYVIAQ